MAKVIRKMDFHAQQYVIAGFLALAAMIAYVFCPQSRAEGLLMLATMLVGFVVGKFSYGFGTRTHTNGGTDDGNKDVQHVQD